MMSLINWVKAIFKISLIALALPIALVFLFVMLGILYGLLTLYLGNCADLTVCMMAYWADFWDRKVLNFLILSWVAAFVVFTWSFYMTTREK